LHEKSPASVMMLESKLATRSWVPDEN